MQSATICKVLLSAGLTIALPGCDDTGEVPIERTIHFVEHADNKTVTDLGAMGDSVGDLLTFANPVFEQTNQSQVGTDQGYCVRVEVGKAWECEWTLFVDKEGQISVSGPFFDEKGSRLSVTGGTNAFENARGDMELRFRDTPAPKVEYDLIYNLNLNQ